MTTSHLQVFIIVKIHNPAYNIDAEPINLPMPTTHTMKLYPEPFEKITHGQKTIELRLFDEKRQYIKVGDTITFQKLPDCQSTTTVEVTGLLQAKSFEALLNTIPITATGYLSKVDVLKKLNQFYTAKQQKQYTVLGIQIKPITQ